MSKRKMGRRRYYKRSVTRQSMDVRWEGFGLRFGLHRALTRSGPASDQRPVQATACWYYSIARALGWLLSLVPSFR